MPRPAAAFLLLFFAVWGSRAGVGLYLFAGIDDYFSTGYGLFAELARNWLSDGVMYFDHPHCTLFSENVYGARPPLYPLFIAAIIALTGGSATCFIVAQTFVSTLTVAVAALTAFRIQGRTSALFTFLFCGFHPYLFAHSTKLQETFLEGCYKVLVNYLGIMSPLQDSWIANAVYFAAYWFLTILAVIGARDPRAFPFLVITIALLVAHSAYSFVFWSHTSHRSYLDPVWCVFAGVGAARLLDRWRRGPDGAPTP